jgi:hypothetical protein
VGVIAHGMILGMLSILDAAYNAGNPQEDEDEIMAMS